jgi:hypothetical protein
MTDRSIRLQPAGRACQDRRALAQRALACELSGELELAVALVRRLQRPDADAGRPAIGAIPGPA